MKKLKEFFCDSMFWFILSQIAMLILYFSMVDRKNEEYKTLSTKYINEVCENIGLLSQLEEKEEEISNLESKMQELEQALEEQPQWTSLGTFKITAYGIDCLGCTGITKSGTVPQTGRTIAVDPTVIPLGSKVMIDGNIYIAEDTGGAIKGKIIDLFYNTEQESAEFGVQYFEVYILEKK